MHIVGPWLSKVGRKRGKKKWPSAEAKQRAEALAESWKDLKHRHGVPDKKQKANPSLTQTPRPVYRDSASTKPQSLNSWVTGAVTSKPAQQYTGDKMLGIGTMHKSNAVPIFSEQEAVDISRMRR
jgi:hypothetical protein